MYFAGSLTGEGSALMKRFKIGATLTNAGQVVILDDAGPGEIGDPTTTAAADVYGIALESGTYSTTQGTGTSSAEVNVLVVYNPLGIFGAGVSGGSGDNEDVALSITENDVAETAGTTVSDSDLPSDSMLGALIWGLTGANKSQSRIVTTFVSASSLVVQVPFDGDIASGDDFLVFGFSHETVKINLTTNFTQVSQWFPSATGVDAAVVQVIVDDHDSAAPTAKLHFVFRDHVYNPLS